MGKKPTVRDLRKAAGLTIEELSKESNVAWSTLQALESGRGRTFSASIKQRLADYFKVQLGDLFPEEAIKRIIAKTQEFDPAADEKKWKAAWDELRRIGRG